MAEAAKLSLTVLSHIRCGSQGSPRIENRSSLKKNAVTTSHALKKMKTRRTPHLGFPPDMQNIMLSAIHVPHAAYNTCATSPARITPATFATTAEGSQKAK